MADRKTLANSREIRLHGTKLPKKQELTIRKNNDAFNVSVKAISKFSDRFHL